MAERAGGHVSEHDLLLFLDGEVDKTHEAYIRQHLAACWSCRVHRDELQARIATVVRALDEIVLPEIPPPPRPWQGLEPHLARLDQQLASEPRRTRWRMATEGIVETSHRRWAAAVAVIVVAFVVVLLQQRHVTAKELLAGARRVEQLDVHRQLTLDERHSPQGSLVARHRIDVWQSATTRESARRLYNERGELIAGEWTRPDGTRTLYRRGEAPRVEKASDLVAMSPDNVWRLEPTAATFVAIVGDLNLASVDRGAEMFVVSASLQASPAPGPGAIAVSLTLGEGNLHPTGFSVTFAEGGNARTFRLSESVFAETLRTRFPVAAFLPEKELTAGPVEAPLPAPSATAVARRRLNAQELLDLEIDALVRLNRVGALLGEQVSVGRTPNGLLRIEALVESDARRAELAGALESLAPRWAVRSEIYTFTEAQRRRSSGQPASATVRSVDITSGRAPVYEDLKRFFAERLEAKPVPGATPDATRLTDEGGTVEQQIREFTRRVLERSLDARLHARALAEIAGRVSPSDLPSLAPDRKQGWEAIVREHAVAFRHMTEGLRADLQPIFFVKAGDALNRPPAERDPVDLWHAASRLFELATAHDATVAQAFTVSTLDSSSVRLKSTEFWQSLLAAETLAADLQDALAAARSSQK